MSRLGAPLRTRITRLRLLKRWGQFTEETVTLVDSELDDQPSGIRIVELNEILDLDDEDAETGLPYGRERPN